MSKIKQQIAALRRENRKLAAIVGIQRFIMFGAGKTHHQPTQFPPGGFVSKADEDAMGKIPVVSETVSAVQTATRIAELVAENRKLKQQNEDLQFLLQQSRWRGDRYKEAGQSEYNPQNLIN